MRRPARLGPEKTRHPVDAIRKQGNEEEQLMMTSKVPEVGQEGGGPDPEGSQSND